MGGQCEARKRIELMVTEENLTLGGERTIEYTGIKLSSFIPGYYIMLLTNGTPINLIKNH